MTSQRIVYDIIDQNAYITLNRASKRNALDDLMVKELTSGIALAGKDPNIKTVVLRANGPAFCAGADLEYLTRVSKFSLEENRTDSDLLAHLFKSIYELRKPVIAVVNGPALAGGCGLATVCDFVIASEEKAQFGYTEVRIGFIPAIVMVFLVRRVGEAKARELVLRGNILNAGEAKEAGLVNIVVPENDLESTLRDLVRELHAKNSALAMGLCKEMLSKLNGLNLVEALDFAANMNAAARMTPDCKKGVAAFLNKQKIEW